jgi:hypothetical protein
MPYNKKFWTSGQTLKTQHEMNYATDKIEHSLWTEKYKNGDGVNAYPSE